MPGMKPARLDPKYMKKEVRDILLDRIIQLYLEPATRVAPNNTHLQNIIGNHADCDPVGDVIARLQSDGVDLSDLLRKSDD